MNNFAAGFGDYLVPALVVIWVIFSILKKFGAVRTGPAQTTTQTEEQDSTGSIKTLLEQMLLGEEFTAKQPTRNAAQTTTHEEKQTASEAFRPAPEPAPFLTYESDLYKGGEMAVTAPTVQKKSSPEVSAEQSVAAFHWDTQDLKRAIILSEILKRPYL